MKVFFAKLKDFPPKLKVSENLLFLKPQNRWEKAWGTAYRLNFMCTPRTQGYYVFLLYF